MTPIDARHSGTVLVTGGSGYLGGQLTFRLRQEGRTVRALVRPTSRVEHLQAAGVELIQGDIRNAADVARAAEAVETIYHIAGAFRTAGHSNQTYVDVNVGGIANVLAAAKRHGVAWTVRYSTVGVHGDVQEIPCSEDSPQSWRRLSAQQDRGRASGPRGTRCRPAGRRLPSLKRLRPRDLRNLKLFKALRQGTFCMFGSGETLFHPVYVDDLIEGFLLCGSRSAVVGRTYILAGPEYVTLNQWAAAAAKAVGQDLPRRRLPYWPLSVAAAVCEAICVPLGIEPPLHRRRARFFVNNRAFSSKRARNELGYAPKVGVVEGCQRTAAWCFERGYLD